MIDEMCVMGDGLIGDEPFYEDDGDFIHQRCAMAALDRAIDEYDDGGNGARRDG